jgi:hypothetical protein
MKNEEIGGNPVETLDLVQKSSIFHLIDGKKPVIG